MLQQCAVGEVDQPDLQLKGQVIERSQHAPTGRLGDDHIPHGVAFGDHSLGGNADGHEHGLNCVGHSTGHGSPIFDWHDDWQQGSLTHGQDQLRSPNADEVGVPVAKDRIGWGRLRLRCGIDPVQELLGTAKSKHGLDSGLR